MTVYILLFCTVNEYGDYTDFWIDSVWNTREEAEKRLDSIHSYAYHAYRIEEKKIGVI